MGNSNLRLPGWAQTALAAALLISISVNGTLLLNDRNNMAKFIEEQRGFTATVARTINGQNRIFDRLCGLLTQTHEQRLESIKLYPLTMPEDLK